MTAYASAALSALAVGYLADRYGRKKACLSFCAIHSTACLTVLSHDLRIIFVGRALSGVALTLLWTVFESWVVTEYNSAVLRPSENRSSRGLPLRDSRELGALFGLMTTSNCLAAILGGVLAHCIVLAMGSKRSLFVFGLVSLLVR